MDNIAELVSQFAAEVSELCLQAFEGFKTVTYYDVDEAVYFIYHNKSELKSDHVLYKAIAMRARAIFFDNKIYNICFCYKADIGKALMKEVLIESFKDTIENFLADIRNYFIANANVDFKIRVRYNKDINVYFFEHNNEKIKEDKVGYEFITKKMYEYYFSKSIFNVSFRYAGVELNSKPR